jgi:hypothetical protein
MAAAAALQALHDAHRMAHAQLYASVSSSTMRPEVCTSASSLCISIAARVARVAPLSTRRALPASSNATAVMKALPATAVSALKGCASSAATTASQAPASTSADTHGSPAAASACSALMGHRRVGLVRLHGLDDRQVGLRRRQRLQRAGAVGQAGDGAASRRLHQWAVLAGGQCLEHFVAHAVVGVGWLLEQVVEEELLRGVQGWDEHSRVAGVQRRQDLGGAHTRSLPRSRCRFSLLEDVLLRWPQGCDMLVLLRCGAMLVLLFGCAVLLL